MNAYTSLAQAYDRLTWDVDYAGILDYIEALLRERGKRPETVLDLACGTGSLSVLLARRGYRVTGVDMSEDMLAVASEKACALEENVPFFVCQRFNFLPICVFGENRLHEIGYSICIFTKINFGKMDETGMVLGACLVGHRSFRAND